MRVIQRAALLLGTGIFLFSVSGILAQTSSWTYEGRSFTEQAGVQGQDFPASVAYHSDIPHLRRVSDPSGDYLRMFLTGHHQTSEPGKPEMPVYSRLIEVPHGMEVVVSLSEIKTQTIKFSDRGLRNAELYPAQPARTKNEVQDEKITVKDKEIYTTKGIIGHDTVIVSREGIFRGHNLYNVAVYPAFYNPLKGYIDLITSMNIDLSLKSSGTKGDEEPSSSDDKGGYASSAYITGYTDKPVNMIIVTDSIFREQLTPLIEWKMFKGIKTTVFYREQGPADTVYYHLKQRISEFYNNSLAAGIPVEYILIVGDPSLIPTSRGTTNVSDLYYGEFDGEGDYIPELFIGRLPVSDTTQLKTVVKKIIDYETYNYSPTNDFWSAALVTAGNAAGFELYMNGQVQYIYNNYFGQDPSVDAVRWFYPDAQLKDDSLKILFNKGLSILNYTGHGEAAGFSDPAFKASMVSALVNKNEYPLIIANACRTAQISVTPCFGTAVFTAQDKGAIGYIGCTNDSYWTDDFFWAVGPGTPALDITYETSGAGAFDGLFHTHDEPPGEWYYTMGQINFSGNMSVSSSTSPRKKYYWETYMLLGDPSLSPYFGKPDTFAVELPDTLPYELSSLNFFSKPFAYAALSDFDTLWDAKFISPSGNISLSVPDGDKDSCLLVITGQNMVPYMKAIHFGSVPGAFIVAEDIVFDDALGNGDGVPDYGEEINLQVTVRNLGEDASSDLTAALSVISGMITVNSGSAAIGVLAPGESRLINGNFVFTVSDEVEDGELASLLMNLTDNGDEYNFGIDMTLHAPQLRIISAIHDDISTGNSNFLPDPGETINIRVKVKNEGSSKASGTVSLTPSVSLLQVHSSELETGDIEPGEEKEIIFEADISYLAYPGTVIPFDVNFVCGNYEAQGTWNLCTGKTRETWEFDRFDIFPWIQHELNPWTITSSLSWENSHSARSGVIPDKSESVLAIYVNNPVEDTVSFYSRVSSEPNYDELVFRIDSVNILRISGDTPWAFHEAVLMPGVHYLEWAYIKDVSLSGGLDAVWIDQITFPDISFLDADLHIDTVYPPPATADLSNVTISGSIINFGRNALTSFPLAYMINDGELVNETFFIKIDPGDTVDVSFFQKCSLQPDVSYLISILSRLPEDGYSGNDTASVSFIKSATGPAIPDGSARLLPNPFFETFVLEIDFEGDQTADMELIDASGRQVLRFPYGLIPGRNRVPFDCRHLASGVYTLRINIEGKSSSMRVVKAKR
jgi:hypothetical protein